MLIFIRFPIPFSKKSRDAKRHGKRLVSVSCDKCKCSFYFELVRAGIASSTDFNEADRDAHQALETRLASDADLVACPKCNWISDDLIKRYRKRRFRPFEAAMLGTGILGILCSFLAAYLIDVIGNRSSIDLPWYFTYVLPAILAGFVGICFLLSNFLRSRVQPNRTFPGVPDVPLGTAPALFKQAEKLVLARSRNLFEGADEGIIYFFPQHDKLPQKCCYCFDKSIRCVSVPVTSACSAEIPFCAKCRKELDGRQMRVFWSAMGLSIVIGAGLGYWLDSIWCVGATTLVVSFTLSLVVAGIAVPFPWRVIRKQHPFGQICLQFSNQEFARVAAKHLTETAAQAGARAKEADRGEFKAAPEGERASIRGAEPSGG